VFIAYRDKKVVGVFCLRFFVRRFSEIRETVFGFPISV
jgi:hypothetical protein